VCIHRIRRENWSSGPQGLGVLNQEPLGSAHFCYNLAFVSARLAPVRVRGKSVWHREGERGGVLLCKRLGRRLARSRLDARQLCASSQLGARCQSELVPQFRWVQTRCCVSPFLNSWPWEGPPLQQPFGSVFAEDFYLYKETRIRCKRISTYPMLKCIESKSSIERHITIADIIIFVNIGLIHKIKNPF